MHTTISDRRLTGNYVIVAKQHTTGSETVFCISYGAESVISLSRFVVVVNFFSTLVLFLSLKLDVK